MTTDTRIYAACLASYNSGTLHGVWIDCDGKDADDLQTEVADMLRASPFPNVTVDCPDCDGPAEVAELGDPSFAPCDTCKGSGKVPSAEEFAIHDHEGFGDLIGESSSLAEVAKHAELIGEHGEAWVAYCGHVGEDYATASGFQDAYRGTYDSERDYAEQFADDLGYLDQIPEFLRMYFDFDAFARDLFINDYWRDDDTGAVFDRNAG